MATTLAEIIAQLEEDREAALRLVDGPGLQYCEADRAWVRAMADNAEKKLVLARPALMRASDLLV